MANKVKFCMFKLYDIEKPPKKVKCGSIASLNGWAKREGLKFQRNRDMMFGGYYNDDDGNSYIVDMVVN